MYSNYFAALIYHWFSHDVTKIQNEKLSILPRFYFHYALEQLKTNFHTNFRFERGVNKTRGQGRGRSRGWGLYIFLKNAVLGLGLGLGLG